MIPAKVIRFLEEGANVGFAGTCDRNLVPAGHRVAGWQVGAGGRTLTAFVPDPFAPRLVEALRDNGRIALTFEEVGTHETYQLKGRYIGHRPVEPAEVERATNARDRFARNLRALHGGDERAEAAIKASIAPPTLAFEVEVLEVFVQTPGPGAGARIAPPPDAEVSRT